MYEPNEQYSTVKYFCRRKYFVCLSLIVKAHGRKLFIGKNFPNYGSSFHIHPCACDDGVVLSTFAGKKNLVVFFKHENIITGNSTLHGIVTQETQTATSGPYATGANHHQGCFVNNSIEDWTTSVLA